MVGHSVLYDEFSFDKLNLCLFLLCLNQNFMEIVCGYKN